MTGDDGDGRRHPSGAGGFAYTWRNVVVRLGDGVTAGLPGEMERLGVRRGFLVTTPGRAGAAASVRDALGDGLVGGFSGARAHVPAAVVEEALGAMMEAEGDCCVTLGGGSAIGLAKAIALETGCPVIALPTTYSGSEMTSIWGITGGDGKRTGRNARVAPRAVLYDPALSVDLPPPVTAASGMNAVAHCVEALYAADANPVASLLAEEGIRLMARCLPELVRRPTDLVARAEALTAAHLAGCALDMTSMGLHHRLCHLLGGSFGLPHAMTHAVLLPHVAAYNGTAADAMRRVAAALDAREAWTGLFFLNRGLGITATLADLGLAEGDLARVAASLDRDFPNPRPVTDAGVRAVLRGAFDGVPPVWITEEL